MATPTMKDVAKEAGVSLGTVSKVINNIPVGEAYRKKVLEASAKLGYQVNSYARALRTSKSCCIAVIVPTIRHPFFASLVDAVTAALLKEGYWAELMTTNYDPACEETCISLVRQNRADGIIALTYHPNLVIDDDIPFISIDRYFSSKIPCVSSDNYGGGMLAVEKLLELGARKLLFLRRGSTVSGEVDKRGSGFENACRLHNIPYDSLSLTDDDPDEMFFRYVEQHFGGKEGPEFDGIFCNTDHLAVKIREMLRRFDIRVPEDVQIIGYDGIRDYLNGSYLCSTIVQPVEEMAQTAVSLLLHKEQGMRPMLVNLPVQYEPGGTTRENQ